MMAQDPEFVDQITNQIKSEECCADKAAKEIAAAEKAVERAGKAYHKCKQDLADTQTAMNKEASISLPYQGKRIFAEKTADTFEDAILQVLDSLKVQIEKLKNA